MSSDSFQREISVSADPETAWERLTDVERVAGWVQIVSDVQEHEHLSQYEAVLEDRLGPFRLLADLDITLSDVEPGRSLHVHAEGEDRQVASQISVDADLSLTPGEDSGTTISVDGHYAVSGRVATLGAPMIKSKAQKIIDEFFENAVKDLS